MLTFYFVSFLQFVMLERKRVRLAYLTSRVSEKSVIRMSVFRSNISNEVVEGVLHDAT